MAIRLEVADYCQNCAGFKAEVRNAEKISTGCYGVDDYILTNTVVTCTDKDRCRNLYRYLEKEIKAKEIDRQVKLDLQNSIEKNQYFDKYGDDE